MLRCSCQRAGQAAGTAEDENADLHDLQQERPDDYPLGINQPPLGAKGLLRTMPSLRGGALVREELRNWAEANTRWDMQPAEDSRHYDTFVRTEDTAANATSVADYIYNLLQGKGVPVSAEQVAALVEGMEGWQRAESNGGTAQGWEWWSTDLNHDEPCGRTCPDGCRACWQC